MNTEKNPERFFSVFFCIGAFDDMIYAYPEYSSRVIFCYCFFSFVRGLSHLIYYTKMKIGLLCPVLIAKCFEKYNFIYFEAVSRKILLGLLYV